MSWKTFLIVSLALVNVSVAKTVVPSFKWINDSKSEDGVQMLKIKFPDNLANEIAVLKKVEPGCNLEGHLKFDKNATVNITKECDDDNNYQVYIDSQHLAFTSYKVSDDQVNPVIPKEENPVEASIKEMNYEVPQNPLKLRLYGYYDSKFKSKLLDATIDVVTAIIEDGKTFFTLPTLQYKVNLELVGVEEAEDTLTPENFQESDIIPRKASEYDEPINAFVLFTDEADTEVSTGTKIGSICSSNANERTVVVYWKEEVEETGKSLAHELGRLLGMGDDYQWNPVTNKIRGRYADKNTLCTNINGIMDYSSKQTVWSPCSNLDFIQYYNKVKSESDDDFFCLKESQGNYEILEGNLLRPGAKLEPGVRIQSTNGYFYLTVSSDGVFGLFCHKDGRNVWTPSDAWHEVSASAIFHDDGNFVVYDSEGKANWATNTWDSPESFLVVQDNGDLVLYSNGNDRKWTSHSRVAFSGDDSIITAISTGESVYSANKKYYIHMQSDNNLVVRSSADNKTLWSTNTEGSRKKPTRAVFQTDGNLALYDNNYNRYWSTETQGNPGATMKVLNSGALVIFSYNKKRLFSTGVNGNWGEWAFHGECSVSCGEGVRTLKRVCDSPAPSNGGLACEGSDTDTTSCNYDLCPDWTNNCVFIDSIRLKFILDLTIQECASTCAKTSGCTHYNWNGICSMKTGKKTRQEASKDSDQGLMCGVVASLRGGRNSSEGNVFATNPTSGKFGPICGDGWTKANGNVICKQLGYKGVKYETKKSYLDLGNLGFSYANVKCSGSEKLLENCRHSTGDICNGGHAAGVICTED